MLHILTLGIGLSLAAGGAHAACSVQYKAKRDNPLELFFNSAVVAEPCTRASAKAQLRPVLAAQGLKLLKIVSVKKQ